MSTGLFGVVATFRFYKSEDLGSNPGLIYIYVFFSWCVISKLVGLVGALFC